MPLFLTSNPSCLVFARLTGVFLTINNPLFRQVRCNSPDFFNSIARKLPTTFRCVFARDSVKIPLA